jgi:hypothetical protein
MLKRELSSETSNKNHIIVCTLKVRSSEKSNGQSYSSVNKKIVVIKIIKNRYELP